MIEPARRHGHSDPRYPVSYFAQFSARSRAGCAAGSDANPSTALDDWEGEGGAAPPQMVGAAIPLLRPR